MNKIKRAVLVIFAICMLCSISLFVACSNADSNKVFEDIDNNSNVLIQREIAYNASVGITVNDVEKAKNAVDDKLKEFNGFIERSSESYSDNEISYYYVVYRIPTESFNEFISFLSENNNVTSKKISTVDYTDEHVNLRAQREALEGKKAMLNDLLLNEKITASDKIAVISEISDVDVQIKIIDISLSDYQKEVNYSTVTLSINPNPSFLEIFMPIFAVIIAPILILAAIFVPKIIKRRKGKKSEV